MEKRYPQEEERGYIGKDYIRKKGKGCAADGWYLLFLARKGTADENAMSASEFSRNIWLMDEHDKEIWRIHSYADEKGFKFNSLSLSHTEYAAYRQIDDQTGDHVFVIDMESGLATPCSDSDYYANRYKGPDLELVKKWETRIYLNNEDYLIMDAGLRGTYKRNIVRINGKGEEVWRIWTAGTDDYHFEDLYVRNGKCIASYFDDRIHFSINPDTGEASDIDWRDIYKNNIETTQDMPLIRMGKKGISRPYGENYARYSEIQGLTPQEIKQYLDLEFMPDVYQRVIIPKGQELLISRVDYQPHLYPPAISEDGLKFQIKLPDGIEIKSKKEWFGEWVYIQGIL